MAAPREQVSGLLRVRLAARDGELDAALAMIDERLPGCWGHTERDRVLEDLQRREALYQEVLEGACEGVAVEAVAVATALAGLAEVRQAQGRSEEAAELVGRFEAHWPDADGDVALNVRVGAVR